MTLGDIEWGGATPDDDVILGGSEAIAGFRIGDRSVEIFEDGVVFHSNNRTASYEIEVYDAVATAGLPELREVRFYSDGDLAQIVEAASRLAFEKGTDG
ncbi:hypothetical protein HY346_01070 [Candidatus Microgenomates bacterium]|nr:hypothetical protein [Candidatus Microgenomates bacterium]